MDREEAGACFTCPDGYYRAEHRAACAADWEVLVVFLHGEQDLSKRSKSKTSRVGFGGGGDAGCRNEGGSLIPMLAPVLFQLKNIEKCWACSIVDIRSNC